MATCYYFRISRTYISLTKYNNVPLYMYISTSIVIPEYTHFAAERTSTTNAAARVIKVACLSEVY